MPCLSYVWGERSKEKGSEESKLGQGAKTEREAASAGVQLLPDLWELPWTLNCTRALSPGGKGCPLYPKSVDFPWWKAGTVSLARSSA